MAILDGVDIVYIERCRSASIGQREIDLNLHVGSRLPAYCTSMGKVLLAGLDSEELDARIARMELSRRGPNTIVGVTALVDELARVRRHGIAVNNEELAYGLRSIAARCAAGRVTTSPQSISPSTGHSCRWRISSRGSGRR